MALRPPSLNARCISKMVSLFSALRATSGDPPGFLRTPRDAATADRRPDSEHLRISQGPAPALVVWWWRCRSATWGKHMPRGRFNRRDLISGLAVAASVWPLAARAQQPAMPVIGMLDSRSPDALMDRLRGFRQGLKDTGYVEGENVAIEYRWAENQFDRLPALAAELV